MRAQRARVVRALAGLLEALGVTAEELAAVMAKPEPTTRRAARPKVQVTPEARARARRLLQRKGLLP